MDINVCNYLIKYWGIENDLLWSSKKAGDSVNPTCYYQLVSDDLNILNTFEHLLLLRQIIENRLRRIFPSNKFILWESFVQKYWKGNNIFRMKNFGSMVGHVDGGEHTGDIASVAYTMHLGKHLCLICIVCMCESYVFLNLSRGCGWWSLKLFKM